MTIKGPGFELDSDDVMLEEDCPDCNDPEPNKDCETCGGTHVVPTALGQKFIDFIRKYTDVSLRR